MDILTEEFACWLYIDVLSVIFQAVDPGREVTCWHLWKESRPIPGHPPGASPSPTPGFCCPQWAQLRVDPVLSPLPFPVLTTCGARWGVVLERVQAQAAHLWAALGREQPLPSPSSTVLLGSWFPILPLQPPRSPFLAVWSLSWQPSRPQGCISAAIGLNLFSHFPVECVSWVPGSNEQEEWAGLGVPPASGLSLACRPWGPLLCRRRAPGSAPPCHRLCFSA